MSVAISGQWLPIQFLIAVNAAIVLERIPKASVARATIGAKGPEISVAMTGQLERKNPSTADAAAFTASNAPVTMRRNVSEFSGDHDPGHERRQGDDDSPDRVRGQGDVERPLHAHCHAIVAPLMSACVAA